MGWSAVRDIDSVDLERSIIERLVGTYMETAKTTDLHGVIDAYEDRVKREI